MAHDLSQSGDVVKSSTRPQSGPVFRCWDYAAATSARGAITSDDSRVFLISSRGDLQAIDLQSGKLIWATDLGGDVNSNLVVADGNVYVTTQTGSPSDTIPLKSRFHSVSGVTGLTRWAVSLAAEAGPNSISLQNGIASVISSHGALANYRIADGAMNGSFPAYKGLKGALLSVSATG